jgi:hypothetical protein
LLSNIRSCHGLPPWIEAPPVYFPRDKSALSR